MVVLKWFAFATHRSAWSHFTIDFCVERFHGVLGHCHLTFRTSFYITDLSVTIRVTHSPVTSQMSLGVRGSLWQFAFRNCQSERNLKKFVTSRREFASRRTMNNSTAKTDYFIARQQNLIVVLLLLPKPSQIQQ